MTLTVADNRPGYGFSAAISVKNRHAVVSVISAVSGERLMSSLRHCRGICANELCMLLPLDRPSQTRVEQVIQRLSFC